VSAVACAHTGELVMREDGRHCARCGALIYAARVCEPDEEPRLAEAGTAPHPG
jgi:hypothetical protein